MKNILILCFIFLFTAFLSAQTADKLEELLASPVINYEQAAWLALEAADIWDVSGKEAAPDSWESFVVAGEQQWLPAGTESTDNARLDTVSMLLMRSFGLKGGLFYSLLPNPHYAYRELVYRGIIQGRADPAMDVSGSMMVFMVNGILAGLETGDWSPVISVKPRGLINKTEN
ncbi:MAG: hypothetical protein FWD78_01165 [Treponema sp.]|nr:hypothetical protein [Treponema sp.]